jgi:FAD/FMN-containing dehydrogenase
VIVNDVQSQLNPTRVHRIARPGSAEELAFALEAAWREGRTVSVCGARHAMGGQQFGADTLLVDMSSMRRVIGFDDEAGGVEVEAGIQWPELVGRLLEAQRGRARQWGIAQKQTGADRLSLGGALAANVHGRGLTMQPIVADVESFVLVGPDGTARLCSRHENADLFRLAIGGYGLFGIVSSVRLRLTPRRKLERIVQLVDVEDLVPAFERRIAEGFLYGDWQYATGHDTDNFLRKGVFSCYRPVPDSTPVPEVQKELSVEQWRELIYLAHVDRRRAFEVYSGYYLTTHGQIYWSDLHQMGVYRDDYHRELDTRLGASERATEVITEVYVPRPALARFLGEVRRDFREERVEVIYGTVRLIERDDETFLAWARDRFACVIFNLHTVHTPAGIERSARAFRHVIDLAIAHGGSYYPTYHRFATRQQVEACYPQFAEFLRRKRLHDPGERFQSDWYRHYRAMFAGSAQPRRR